MVSKVTQSGDFGLNLFSSLIVERSHEGAMKCEMWILKTSLFDRFSCAFA